jgi:hypothetical protein
MKDYKLKQRNLRASHTLNKDKIFILKIVKFFFFHGMVLTGGRSHFHGLVLQRIMVDGREAPMTTKLTGAAEAVVKRKVQVILSFGSRPRLLGGCKCARTRAWPGQCLQALISRHTLQGPEARMTVVVWMSRPSSKSICLLLQTRCCAIMYSSWWAIGRAPARFLSTSR